MRAANTTDIEKQACCQAQMDHLAHVHEERDLYRRLVRESIEAVEDGVKLTSAVKPNQSDSMHYSFDFAQQVHYPANPRQPGPIYFPTF